MSELISEISDADILAAYEPELAEAIGHTVFSDNVQETAFEVLAKEIAVDANPTGNKPAKSLNEEWTANPPQGCKPCWDQTYDY